MEREAERASTLSSASLTQGQRERIELNRQKALALRRSRVRAKPYDKTAPTEYSSRPRLSEDTRGGFLLEGSEAEEAAVWQELHSGPAVQDDGIMTQLHSICLWLG